MATRTDSERYAAMRAQIMASARMDDALVLKNMSPAILEQWHDMSTAVEQATSITDFNMKFDALCDFFETKIGPTWVIEFGLCAK